MVLIRRMGLKRSFFCGILAFCACTIVILNKKYDHTRQNVTRESPGNPIVGQPLDSENFSRSQDHFENISTVSHESHSISDQKRRLSLVTSVCSNRMRLKSVAPIKPGTKRLYFSSKYHVSYCKVPKVGSTYWTQVFQVLRQNTKIGGKIFTQARRHIHIASNRLPRGSFADKETPTIIVTRNPFSRLYSAFIDKSYTMLAAKLNNEIVRRIAPEVRNSANCYKDITFSDFLEFIVKSVKIGAVINEHWAPVYSLCMPCDLNVSFVVKQESFSADVELALKKFKVHKDQFDVLMSALHDHRIEQSLPGIIATAYINTKSIRSCLDAKTLVQRLWESFQIQGYILNQIKFPSEKFPNLGKFEDVKYVTQVIMDTIKKFPITSKESQFQRQSALAHAYKGVDQDIIKAIQKIYKIDFEMFGYSVQPPTLP